MNILQRINKIKSEIGRTIINEETKYDIEIRIVELELRNEQNLSKEIANLAKVISEQS